MRGKVVPNLCTILGILTAAVVLCCLMPTAATAAEDVSPVALFDIVSGHSSRLASLDSNAAATALFISSVGPSLGLQDVAGILSAKGMGVSPKVAQELRLAELSQSVHQLMAALAVWQLAESAYPASSTTDAPSGTRVTPSHAQQEWLSSTVHFTGLPDLLKRSASQPSPETPSLPASSAAPSDLISVAVNVAREAQQQALASWWSLREWKHRIRRTRGLTRLCGTWQWIIHNHQNHQEQKLTMVFPPPGRTTTENPLPVETIVLGDSIYLRWEDRGFVQEDSLLFVTEGHKRDGTTDAIKIEGSFLNNRGGWGPISGKRLAPCPSGS
ncbi:MAG: hypothetical protein LDL14_04205 [Nitrospira sp.]|nr:hypothetical protein [Nitrospira sp.]